MAAPNVVGQFIRNIFRQGQSWDPTKEQESEWDTKVLEYADYWKWFSGKALEEKDTETVSKDGSNPIKYPLQVNPIKAAALVHSYALFGEVPDTPDPMVKTIVDPRDDSEKELAKQAQEALVQVAYENYERDMDMDMGLSSQINGGVVYKITWDPNDTNLSLGVRWENIPVEEFWCSWSGTNYWNLTDAWIKRTIDSDTALEYGVEISGQTAEYREHWDDKERHITVDGKPTRNPDNGEMLSGEHGWGFTNFIYIPHLRAKSFWGLSLVPDGIGLAEELNSRLADEGDAIRLGVHRLLFGTDINAGFPVAQTLPNGQIWINGGKTIGNQKSPSLNPLDPPQIPTGVAGFNSTLLELLRISQFTPSIAYGEEEGSQRSGQTLYNRMWPTLAHVGFERGWWTMGKNLKAEMTLRLLAKYKRGGITEKHLNLRKRQIWAPRVPVDRAALVQEIIARASTKLISPKHALELLGDTPNIDDELSAIEQWTKKLAELEAKANPAPFGGSSSAGTKPPQTGTNQKGN